MVLIPDLGEDLTGTLTALDELLYALADLWAGKNPDAEFLQQSADELLTRMPAAPWDALRRLREAIAPTQGYRTPGKRLHVVPVNDEGIAVIECLVQAENHYSVNQAIHHAIGYEGPWPDRPGIVSRDASRYLNPWDLCVLRLAGIFALHTDTGTGLEWEILYREVGTALQLLRMRTHLADGAAGHDTSAITGEHADTDDQVHPHLVHAYLVSLWRTGHGFFLDPEIDDRARLERSRDAHRPLRSVDPNLGTVVEAVSYLTAAALGGIIGNRSDAAALAAKRLLQSVINRRRNRTGPQQEEPPTLNRQEAIDVALATAVAARYNPDHITVRTVDEPAPGIWIIHLRAGRETLRVRIPPDDLSNTTLMIVDQHG